MATAVPARPPSLAAAARDAGWLAHRYDPAKDAIHLIRATRADHARATFLTDAELPGHTAPLVLRREDALAEMGPGAPIHFIFHSAYCCSTLLARAFDLPGRAMGLKEPVILNDLVGWRRRGGQGPEVARALDGALALLARPFVAGEAVVVKPSNVVNGLAHAMLAMRPDAAALLLHAPLPVYLGSIARKGMEGRLWVRELLVGLAREGLVAPLGMTPEDLLGQTDLQVAATGWLAQHALFAGLARAHGPDRVRVLDSERLMADPTAAMAALGRLFGIDLPAETLAGIVGGPAFTRHSKSGEAFDAAGRRQAQDAASPHAEEIGRVLAWADAVAGAAGIDMMPGPGLLA